jgi:rhodanese-related sulfurtransferase
MVETISRDELRTALERGKQIALLEVLPAHYFAEAHLPGALNLPLDRLEELAPRLVPDHDSAIVVYCKNEGCRNSEIAARRLARLGYTKVRDYVGGKADWREAGLPVESGLAAAA